MTEKILFWIVALVVFSDVAYANRLYAQLKKDNSLFGPMLCFSCLAILIYLAFKGAFG
jgi:hypothetical protein